MKKIFKKMIAAAIAATMAVGLCISASANSVTDPNRYGSFEWTSTYAKTTNITNDTRIVTAVIKAFSDNTGLPVGSDIMASNIGTYGTYAKVSNTYSSNGYNFQMYGEVYASNSYNSPIVWYTGIKYVD